MDLFIKLGIANTKAIKDEKNNETIIEAEKIVIAPSGISSICSTKGIDHSFEDASS